MKHTSPPRSVQCNKFPGFSVYLACFDTGLQGVFISKHGLTLRAGSHVQLAVEHHFWYKGNLHVDHMSDPVKLSPDDHVLHARDLAPLKDFSAGDPVLPLDVADGS